MSIILRTGEYLWSSDGHHICDANGFAIKCSEDTEITFDSQEIEDRCVPIIRDSRTCCGLDPDTGLPPE